MFLDEQPIYKSICDRICEKGLVHISNFSTLRLMFGSRTVLSFTYMTENFGITAYLEMRLCLFKVTKLDVCTRPLFAYSNMITCIQEHIMRCVASNSRSTSIPNWCPTLSALQNSTLLFTMPSIGTFLYSFLGNSFDVSMCNWFLFSGSHTTIVECSVIT